MLYIQLHQGTSLIARCIKWQTRSKFSHASVLAVTPLWTADIVLESVEGIGVREVPASHYKAQRADGTIAVYRVLDISPEQERQVIAFMRRELGKNYDWAAVLKFISRRRHRPDDRWFCSELVFEAFKSAGVALLHNIEGYQVSPGSLGMSSRLYPVVGTVP